jgi:hypothetical protein
MNALQSAQFQFDGRLPPLVSETPQELAEAKAKAEWIANGVEQLLLGNDVKVKRRLRAERKVTFLQFAQAVDEFAMDQLSRFCMAPGALGMMVIGSLMQCRTLALQGATDALASPAPLGELGRIAEDLLRPLAEEGVKAQVEDDLL